MDLYKQKSEEKLVDVARKLFGEAEKAKQPHEDEIKQAYLMTYPAREFRYGDKRAPDRTQLYDATATEAAKNLNTVVMNLLIPPDKAWCGVTYTKKEYESKLRSQFSRQLDESNDVIFQHFSNSNFYLAMGECMLDAIVSGTACLAFIDGKDAKHQNMPLNYLSIPVSEIYFLDDWMGRPRTVFRKHCMRAGEACDRFHYAPKEWLEKQRENPTREVTILEAVIPCGERYNYAIIDMSGWKLLKVTEQDWNPFVVWRWDRNIGEVWGESPIRQGLPTIRSLNVMTEDILTFAEYAAKGLFQQVDDSQVAGQMLDMVKPGSILVTSSEIKPLTFNGNYPVSQDVLNDQREQLKSLTYNNALPSFANGPTYMTAQEVSARRSEFYQRIGQPALRLQRESLQQIAEQAAGRLQARGELPRIDMTRLRIYVPTAKKQTDVFRIEVNAAITRGIKVVQAQNNIQNVFSIAQGLGANGLNPALVSEQINMEKFIRDSLLDMGLSPEYLRSPEEVEAEKTRIQQQQQMQQMMEAVNSPVGQDLAGRVMDFAQSPKGGPVAAQAIQQLQNQLNPN